MATSSQSALLGCTAIAAVSATPAISQDAVVQWSGLSGIASVGSSVFSFEPTGVSAYDSKCGCSNDLDYDFEDTTVTQMGLGARYDFEPSKNIVVGIRGMLNFGPKTELASVLDYKDGGSGELDYATEIGNSVELSGRVGYANNRTLFYATAGVSANQYNSRTSYDVDGWEHSFDDDGIASGHMVGIGIEHQARNGLSFGVEISESTIGIETENSVEHDGDSFESVTFTNEATIKNRSIKVFVAKRF